MTSMILQVNDAKEIKNTEIAKELSLPPVKLHCSSKLRLLKTRNHCCQNIAPCVEKQFFHNISLFAESSQSTCSYWEECTNDMYVLLLPV